MKRKICFALLLAAAITTSLPAYAAKEMPQDENGIEVKIKTMPADLAGPQMSETGAAKEEEIQESEKEVLQTEDGQEATKAADTEKTSEAADEKETEENTVSREAEPNEILVSEATTLPKNWKYVLGASAVAGVLAAAIVLLQNRFRR